MTISEGARGPRVVEIQEALGIGNDGIFGPGTKSAVEAFQKEHGLVVDGIVGPATRAAILEMAVSTDVSEKAFEPRPGLVVNRHFLPEGQYVEGPTKKEYLFLHHTAGWNNPYKTVDDWASDSRGRIATEFVVGGCSVKGTDDRYDGEVVQCLPEGAYGWHLGKNGSQHMHTHSVAVELCNFSYVENGKTWAGTRVVDDQLVTLAQPFRGHSQWHRYSTTQIDSLRELILWIAERDSIDVRDGVVAELARNGLAAFEYNEDAYFGRVKGMWLHTNTRKDKFDLFPQPEMIDMLQSL